MIQFLVGCLSDMLKAAASIVPWMTLSAIVALAMLLLVCTFYWTIHPLFSSARRQAMRQAQRNAPQQAYFDEEDQYA